MFPSDADRANLRTNQEVMAQLERSSARAAATQPQRDALVRQMEQLQGEYDNLVRAKHAELTALQQEYEGRWFALKQQLDRLLQLDRLM